LAETVCELVVPGACAPSWVIPLVLAMVFRAVTG